MRVSQPSDAVLNNSINFKNRLQKPAFQQMSFCLSMPCIVQVFFIKFRINYLTVEEVTLKRLIFIMQNYYRI